MIRLGLSLLACALLAGPQPSRGAAAPTHLRIIDDQFIVRVSHPTYPTIAWTQVTQLGTIPHWVGYTRLLYDAVSGKILAYEARGSESGIFSTDFFTYTTSTRTWARVAGTGSAIGVCGDGTTSDVTPWPPDRHPIGQWVIAPSWNRLYLTGGVCNGAEPHDTWRWALNSNPALNVWTNVSPATTPGVSVTGASEYSASDDVIVLHGWDGSSFPETWVFCPSSGGLTAAQTAAGCVSANDWARTYNPGDQTPLYSYFPNLVNVPSIAKVLLFGWDVGGSTSTLALSAYDIPTKTWTARTPSGLPSQAAAASSEWLTAYVSSGTWAGKVLFHRTTHQQSGSGQAADYLYDPVANMMVTLTSTGTGPELLTKLAFDPSAGAQGTLVAYEYNADGSGRVWHGVLQ